MAENPDEKREGVLSPVERVSEVIFGLLMAMTFTGSLSVAGAGRDEVRTMIAAALGCNLAWGLADAVMYLVRTATERARTTQLVARIRGESDAARANALLGEALPGRVAAVAGADVLDALRRRVAAMPERRAALLGRTDFAGALGVFVFVVLATFPVVVPFLVIGDAARALRVSQVVALAMLFAGGIALGRYAGGQPLAWGLAMTAVGAALLVAIVALGG